MLSTVMHTTCKAFVAVQGHPITAELTAREKLAFEILHPQVCSCRSPAPAATVRSTRCTARGSAGGSK